MENSGGIGVEAWPYTKKTKYKLVTALEAMWKEAEKAKKSHVKKDEEQIDYASLADIARCTMSIVEATVLSKKLKKSGISRKYEATIYIENGKVAWQLTGNSELPGPGPVLHPIFKVLNIISIMLRIGYHVSIAKSIDLSFDRAKELTCTAMQLFVTNPRSWKMSTLSKEEKELFVEKEKSYSIEAVAHMPYLPNLASPKEDVYKASIEALKLNIARCNELGIKYLVTHLGSTIGVNEHAIESVANAIASCIDSYDGTLLLENEAGQLNSVGSRLEELKSISDFISSKKIGYCLDTCHVFESGYNIAKKEVVAEIANVLGKDNIKVIHLNDAKYPLGSGKDRHENIGFGYIGNEGFRSFFSNKWPAEKIIILETPYSDKISPDEELSLARKLAKS